MRKCLFRFRHFPVNFFFDSGFFASALFSLSLAPPKLEVRALRRGAWPVAKTAPLHISPGAPQVLQDAGVVIAARHSFAYNAVIRDDFPAVSENAAQATFSEPMAFFYAWIGSCHYLFSSFIAARQKATTTMTNRICSP